MTFDASDDASAAAIRTHSGRLGPKLPVDLGLDAVCRVHVSLLRRAHLFASSPWSAGLGKSLPLREGSQATHVKMRATCVWDGSGRTSSNASCAWFEAKWTKRRTPTQPLAVRRLDELTELAFRARVPFMEESRSSGPDVCVPPAFRGPRARLAFPSLHSSTPAVLISASASG
ncbi:hypothetical protein AKJ09_03736 [Labilithrix luteola]|uniref:Uncharacterized protein n=1 Tax=Labilithrix luteola TaxID=1391654 RepID=A0A0K1PU75_9BACT|nr:hypothetical protein AKJ09_03736 [Labilithrix luteola]